ncbi:MAG: S41 family peptidase [Oscillospiraceae bacterium]|mgnify:FL=1|nr:S41 family peptidase [Oscillospiraceae bacterium]
MKKGKLPNFDNKIKLTHLIIACLAVAIVTAILTYVAAIGGFGSKQYLDDARRYIEIEKIIDDNYIGDADYNELYNAAAAAMVKSIGDKWSYFMNAEEYEAYKLSSSNEYSGIGVSVKVNSSGEFEVFSVEESSPAANAGIAVGDIITAIDGEDVSDKTIEDVSLLIRSKVNKDFPMTLESGGDTKTVTVACEIIYKNPVSSRLLDGNIGYIKISNFEAGSSENTKKAIEQLLQTGATSFIFDVRNNPGGLLTELVDLLDYILPEGDLFISVDKSGKETVQTSDKVSLKNKMIVLVNGNSYSAAEFFAAALQEYNWATVVGEQTTGKARSQITLELSDGSAVHISTHKYLTPNRVDLAEAGGVTPDIAVAQDDEKTDKQLETAINALG